jgi:hypothetical protein
LSAPVPAGAAEPPVAGAPKAIAPLDFDSEVIRLVVRRDSVEVQGFYRFMCRPSAAAFMSIYYPYPVDSLLGGARMVSLAARAPSGPWKPLRSWELQSHPGASWRLPADWGDTLEVKAVYRQRLRARYARYIVTSTSAWEHPLRSARFEIVLPAGARSPRFSYPFTKSLVGGRSGYVYETVDFAPDRDIVVEWSR